MPALCKATRRVGHAARASFALLQVYLNRLRLLLGGQIEFAPNKSERVCAARPRWRSSIPGEGSRVSIIDVEIRLEVC